MLTALRVDPVNILLVDDQPSKLLTYDAILRELGENLMTASTPADAFACLLKHEVAVVLVDVYMPELDGFELARMIREHPRCERTSIIFISAVLMTDGDRLRGYDCGAVDYVQVPVIPEILRAKVSVFAELYRKRKELERLNRELEIRVRERTAALEATTAALQEASRRKDEFLAMLAHELRNPLAPIRTGVQLLRIKELSDAQRTRTHAAIDRQVEHLVRLIDDLVDVSRLTRDMITLQREAVSVRSAVERAVEITRPELDARGHELIVQAPDEPLTLDADRTRLVQIIGNVLHNAARFTAAGGRIHVKVERDGPTVIIRVKDNGIGIPAELLSRIFDLFAKGQSKPGVGPGGLGIGLTLARRLAEMHGGAVTAHSAGTGHGAEFVIRLPVLGTIDARPELQPVDQVPVRLPSRRILVADDNHDAAESLTVRLQMAGHDVRTVHDGDEALAVGDMFRPQIALLDLGMPTLDGCETARAIRLRPWGKYVRLVALTGWGQHDVRQRTADAGFDAHLVKPVADVDLFSALAAGGDPAGAA